MDSKHRTRDSWIDHLGKQIEVHSEKYIPSYCYCLDTECGLDLEATEGKAQEEHQSLVKCLA